VLNTREGKNTVGRALFDASLHPMVFEGNTYVEAKRPSWIPLDLQEFRFRVYIFQGINFPATDEEGTCDAACRVTFADAEVMTKTQFFNLQPTFNEAFEVKVHLAGNEVLRPDILFELEDDDDGEFVRIILFELEDDDDGIIIIWGGREETDIIIGERVEKE
jgi:hypothetical protein